jgi:hypothetical protein
MENSLEAGNRRQRRLLGPGESSGVGLEQDDPGPARGVGGGGQCGEAVAVAGAAGQDEFAGGGELEEGAVGQVGAGAVGLMRRQAHRSHR